MKTMETIGDDWIEANGNWKQFTIRLYARMRIEA
jgi:hypothetical protein